MWMHTDNTPDVLSGKVRMLERKILNLEKTLQPARRQIVILIVWQGALSLVGVMLLAKVIWHL
jgi:hypothetical protein